MDKTSKLFLESEIKRILNLNERIESGDFILENVTAELQKSLDELEKFLVDKLTIEPSLVGVDKNAKGVDEVQPFINNIIYGNFLKGKNYCGDDGMVKCEDLVDFMKDRYINDQNINHFKRVTEIYNTLKRDIEDLLNQGGSSKLAEVMKNTLNREIVLNPFTLDDDEINTILTPLFEIKDEVEILDIIPDLTLYVEGIRKALKNGTYCKSVANVDCNSIQDIESVVGGVVRKLKNQIQRRLSPKDVQTLMKWFDDNIYEKLVAKSEEKFVNMTKEELKQTFSGDFCKVEDCPTKQEVKDRANEMMKGLVTIANAEIPKNMGKFDFLQSKIDQLLVINTKADSDDEEEKVLPLDKLLKMEGDKFKISFSPNKKLKEDKNLNEFISKSGGVLSGEIFNINESSKYFEFATYGEGGRFMFVIPFTREGLVYPKTYSVKVKEKRNGNWEKLYDYDPGFKIKIKNIL